MSELKRSVSVVRARRWSFLSSAVLVVVAASVAAALSAGADARSTATPSNVSPPTVSGTAVVGETLTAAGGSWTGTPPLTFALAWQRCDASGGSCVAIGETGPTYLISTADKDSTLRVVETAKNAEGSASAPSAQTAVVTPQTAPVSTGDPVISGSTVEGATLTTTTGTWTGTSLTFAYRWVRCGADGGQPDGSDCPSIPGATSSSYTLGSADIGQSAPRPGHRRQRGGLCNRWLESDGARGAVDDDRAAADGRRAVHQRDARGGPPPTRERGHLGRRDADLVCVPVDALRWRRWLAGRLELHVDLGRHRVDVHACRRRRRLPHAHSDHGLEHPGRADGRIQRDGCRPVVVDDDPLTGTRQHARPGDLRNRRARRDAHVDRRALDRDDSAPLLLQWLRCPANGGQATGSDCPAISGETGTQYDLTADDVGRRIRLQVTARNTLGSATATSEPTALVQATSTTPPPPTTLPPGAIRLPNGKYSIPVTSVSEPERLVAEQIVFTPNPVRSRERPLELRVRVLDTRGYVVRDALVFARSTPLVTSAPGEQRSARDGWARLRMTPRADFPLGGRSVQFFVRVRKPTDDLLTGVSNRRLVQVATAG